VIEVIAVAICGVFFFVGIPILGFLCVADPSSWR